MMKRQTVMACFYRTGCVLVLREMFVRISQYGGRYSLNLGGFWSGWARLKSLLAAAAWTVAVAWFWVGPAAAAEPALASRWVEHRDPRAGVTIRFPARPSIKHRVTATVVGDIRTKIWMAESEAGEFTISHSYLPRLAAFFATDDRLYDRASEQLIEEHGGGRVTSERNQDGLFERDVRYELLDIEGNVIGVGRMILGNTGKEIIVVNGVVVPDLSDDLDLFFVSFDPYAKTRSQENAGYRV